MMTEHKPVWIVFALAFVSMFSGVHAEERATDDIDLDVTIREDKRMSGAEQIAWIEAQTENARRTAFHTQSMLDAARRDKDSLKITCLDDKLTQIHVNLRGVEERTAALKVAVKANDVTTANQQFAILTIYINRIEGLRVEAEACLGEVDIVLGETQTTVIVAEEITPEDPSQDVVIADNVGVDPIPHASGYY